MRTILILFLFSSLGLLALGCKSKPETSSIAGKVTYQGKPVTGGTMIFHSQEKAFPGSLGPDGSYSCINIPPGEYTVTIDTEPLKNAANADPEATKQKMSAEEGGDPSKIPPIKVPAADQAEFDKMMKGSKTTAPSYVPIPGKYADAKTSGLKVTVEARSTTKDLELTD